MFSDCRSTWALVAPCAVGSGTPWMARDNATIMAVLILVIAVKLIGDAISGLTG